MTRQASLCQPGKPLFFQIADARTLGLQAPPLRLDEALRTHVRALTGMQKEALVTSARTGMTWRLASDEGAYLNGADEAPCPLAFLTTGMVCSYLERILALAASRKIDIANIRLVQDNYYTMRGSALQGTMTGGARNIELEAQIESGCGEDALQELVHDATISSPLSGLVQPVHESLFSLTHNGRPVGCRRVRALDGPAVAAIADSAWSTAMPLASHAPLVTRNGPSPQSPENTSYAGSSLSEQQDRVLHVRGICTLMADGTKHVEQQLFNPHGSIFHFLSDEARINGGRGLAPDAATYASAGIAFCFMTQLGRYASIAKKELRDYAVVQDTHFSAGIVDPENLTGRAGPVETHLHVESDEPDVFAQAALDMSEQTCFLHALCRTNLETVVSIRPFVEAGT